MGNGDGAPPQLKVPESAGEGWLHGEQAADIGNEDDDDDDDEDATDPGMCSGEVMALPLLLLAAAPAGASEDAAPATDAAYPLSGVIGDMTPESAGDGVGW